MNAPSGSAGPLRRVYNWVLGWADRKGGAGALGALAAAESVFFPVPPDALLIPLCLGSPRRAVRFAAICTAGSVIGGVLGYWAGWALYDAVGRGIIEFYGATAEYEMLGTRFRENLVLALGAAGFTPIPYKVFTIAAGGFAVPLAPFIAISAASRGARFLLVALLLRKYGESIRGVLDRHLGWFTLAFFALVVAGFFVVRAASH